MFSTGRDGEGGELFDEVLKFFSFFEVVAQEIDLVGRDSEASVCSVFPALVFVVGAVANDAVPVRRGAFAIFFFESSKLNGFEFSEAGEDFILVGRGTGGMGHAQTMSNYLDMIKGK